MVQDQEVFVKGVEIHKRINDLSTAFSERHITQEGVVLSYDLYFTLMEYTVRLNETHVNPELLLWELLNHNDLFFDTGTRRLHISVDFFSSLNTVNIY